MKKEAIAKVVTPGARIAKASTSPAMGGGLDGPTIERLTGAKGQLDPVEGVFRVSVPPSDLHVTVGGARIVPAQGLTSWAAFEGTNADARVMGDLVLTEDQVNPVMSVALDNGIDVTALHNHFLWDSPKVMFMHIGGMGGAQGLASAASTRWCSGADDVDGGMGAGNAMGVNTWAAFAGSDEEAVIDGDFAVLETELQPVLTALRSAGIDVVAIHHHMTGESPRMLFLHYWGIGSTTSLARGLRAALDRTAVMLEAR